MRPRTNHSRISMTKKRPARRVGGHIESLEDRQMMFGDGAMVADHALVGVSPAGPIFDIPSLDLPAVPRSADCIDFQDLPADKTKVRQFDLSDVNCDDVSRVLVNSAAECNGDGLGPGDCMTSLSLRTRAEIEFGS